MSNVQTIERTTEEVYYNQKVKDSFLDEYPTSTRNTYKRIFVASASMEQEIEKDLYNFNGKEIVEFLSSLKPLTFASSRTNGRIVSAYLYWSIKNGLRYNVVNPLENVKPKWFEQFVSVEQTELYMTESELHSIERELRNEQDAVILRLLFNGVQGKGCQELVNLKRTDILSNNILRLTTIHEDESKTERLLPVDDECIRLVRRASNQRQYEKRNGVIDDSYGTIQVFIDLVDNEYVLRNSLTRTDKYHAPVDKHTIYRRIDMIKDFYGIPHLTVKNIVKSGMIYWAKKLLDQYGVLNKEQYEKIAERFQVNGWWNIQEWANEKVISSLYNE